MAKKDVKRSSKLAAAPPLSQSKRRGPPEPFKPAPPTSHPFLSILSHEHIYITHIDRFPAELKKRVFAIPVALNVGITALLAWRLYIQIPWYLSLLMTLWGYESATTVDKSKHTLYELFWILGVRVLHFMIDYVLASYIGPWPYTFFFEGGGNPTNWRISAGFRDKEIYVRKSRSFMAKELLEASTQGADNPFFKVRILPAVDQQYLREKTGYLMMGADWDLDFGAMTVAEKMVDEKKIAQSLFERSVWIHCGDSIGWAVWNVDEEEGSVDDDEFLKALARQAAKDRGED